MATDFTKCEQCGADIDEGEWFCSQKCYEDMQADIEDRENAQRDEEQEELEIAFIEAQNRIIRRRESGEPYPL